MLFAIRFTDKPNMAELRVSLLTEHIAWLDQHKAVILVGGSLRDTPEQNPVGGLWIAEAESKSALMQLIETDPFWCAGLRSAVEILH
ncbi:MAG: hypothetical protein E6Q34_04670, partial [Burkholderiaceae bacterium]